MYDNSTIKCLVDYLKKSISEICMFIPYSLQSKLKMYLLKNNNKND